MQITKHIPTADTMEALGSKLAKVTEGSAIIFLQGDLGMGKTTLVRGYLRGLDYQGPVKSPTYTLVESYDSLRFPVYHFDLYRLTDPEELEFMGVRDYFSGQGVCLIEWPENGVGMLPAPDLNCYIQGEGEGRIVNFKAYSEIGKRVIIDIN